MTDTIEISSQHSEVGPSASERWLECPGSVLLSRDVEDQSSWFAAEGNVAHDLSERCRNEGKPAEHWRGTKVKVDDFEFEIDQEFIDNVDEFVEWVEQWPGEALVEARVSYEEYVPGGFGTLDDGRVIDGLCRITDLKYGKGVQVYAKDNPQLKLYALGTYLKLKDKYKFRDFILTIHQPRLNHVDSFEITLDDLLEWAETVVKPTAAIALQPNAPLKAGDHCRFCPIRKPCKVRADYVLNSVSDEFDDLDEKEIKLLTLSEVGMLLPRLPNIKKWCDDLEAYAKEQVAMGKPVVHPDTGPYKIVEGRAVRNWIGSDDDVFDALALEFDDADRLWERKLLSPAKAEKALGKKIDISDLIEKPPGSPTLVPGTDKRPPMEIKVENEFEDLDDDF